MFYYLQGDDGSQIFTIYSTNIEYLLDKLTDICKNACHDHITFNYNYNEKSYTGYGLDNIKEKIIFSCAENMSQVVSVNSKLILPPNFQIWFSISNKDYYDIPIVSASISSIKIEDFDYEAYTQFVYLKKFKGDQEAFRQMMQGSLGN